MSGKVECAGCKNPILGRILKCHECGLKYDLACANVSEDYFTRLKTERKAWSCVECTIKRPRGNNTNTPVRTHSDNVNRTRGAAVKSSEESLGQSASTAHNKTEELSDTQMILTEMRLFREELRATRLQMETLNNTISSLSLRIDDCDCKITNLDTRVRSLETRLVDGPTTSLMETIEQLKAEIHDRDQELLSNDLEITGLPEERGENTEQIVRTLGIKLGVTLTEHELVSASRVGRSLESTASPRPRPIVVRLARRATRDQLIKSARVRRDITTEGTGLPVPYRRFYVNERLTKLNRQLFRLTRDAGKRLGWRFVWTRDGKIFARKHAGSDSPRYQIRSEADLRRVFGPDAVSASSSLNN